MNPWGLTPREEEVMSAIVQHGAAKDAAKVLAVGPKSIEGHLSAVKRKMSAPHMVLAAVKWDRFARETNWSPQPKVAKIKALKKVRVKKEKPPKPIPLPMKADFTIPRGVANSVFNQFPEVACTQHG